MVLGKARGNEWLGTILMGGRRGLKRVRYQRSGSGLERKNREKGFARRKGASKYP